MRVKPREEMKMKMGTKTGRKRTPIVALTLMLTMLAPMSASMLVPMSVMATTTTDSSVVTFDATKKIATEKAKLITETYGISSVQYASLMMEKLSSQGMQVKRHKGQYTSYFKYNVWYRFYKQNGTHGCHYETCRRR